MIHFDRTHYLRAAQTPGQFPDDTGGEVAFAGRSNAGKSSLINAVCRQRKLARTGKTPGATRLIHFFETQENLRLVDLPGYGFARVSKDERAQWRRMVSRYLENRGCLRGLVVAMDIRRPLTELDMNLLEWCDARVLIALTKSDKLSKSAAAATRKKVRAAVPEVDEVIAFSKNKTRDADAVRKVIASWWQGA